MSDETIQEIGKRYKDGHVGRALGLVVISMLVNAFFTGLIMWKAAHPTEAPYFTTTNDSHATPIEALDIPNQSDSAIIDWASQAAVTINTYNFRDWESQINNNARGYFSAEGWAQFYPALLASNNFQEALDKKLRVSCVVNRKPVILSKGELNGQYTWKVEVPLFETYESPGSSGVEKLIVSLLISRISTREAKEGIGIIEYRSSSVGSIV